MTQSTRHSADPDHTDLTRAVVLVPPDPSRPEVKAVDMLLDEVEKRTLVRWPKVSKAAQGSPTIALGQVAALKAMPGPVGRSVAADPDDGPAEGYSIRVVVADGAPIVVVAGNDARGVLFGVGRLLRGLDMTRDRLSIDAGLCIRSAPKYPLRGHQIGYRNKTNSYCGWDLPQWEQYIRDLAVFGANAIEVIPPRSDDDADSVHFPRPPLEMMAGVSRLADDYGLDLWIWYPAMDDDYSDPDTVEFALQEWAEVFRALPRIDVVFVPGGDPGDAPPRDLLALMEKQKASLCSIHPDAQIWVSPQGFSGAWKTEFYRLLSKEPVWLDGVVHGPWVQMTLEDFRAKIPQRYPIRHYPDITHTTHCQYPAPDWDLAFQLTAGREPINPRPKDMAAVFHYSQPHTCGFLTYSEGCNDDVNKCVWSGLGWDPEADVEGLLVDYGRYYIDRDLGHDFARGLLGLERNWRGSPLTNAGIPATLASFQATERAASPGVLKNWRFQMALYRAYYDAYTARRLAHETVLERRALDALAEAEAKGSALALSTAERILNQAVTDPVAPDLRQRVFTLAEALFQSIHMQLSVPLYRAKAIERGANLDSIDVPLNNRTWLIDRFRAIARLDKEPDRLAAIRQITGWTDPGPGGVYLDLGTDSDREYLTPGPGYSADPAQIRSPLRGFLPIYYRQLGTEDPIPLRTSWMRVAEAVSDSPLTLVFNDLDPEAAYAVKVTYAGTSGHIRIRLDAADGVEIHPYLQKPYPYRPLTFDVPLTAIRGGRLTLTWHREPIFEGIDPGRGCQVAEVWLLKR